MHLSALWRPQEVEKLQDMVHIPQLDKTGEPTSHLWTYSEVKN